jgi:peroxiredoxin
VLTTKITKNTEICSINHRQSWFIFVPFVSFSPRRASGGSNRISAPSAPLRELILFEMSDTMFHSRRRRIVLVGPIIAAALIGCSEQKPTPPIANTASKEDAKPHAVVEESVRPAAADVALASTTSPPSTASKQPIVGPQERSAFYRADSAPPKEMPKVQLSKREQALCKVNVGDAMPEIELPNVDNGEKVKLASLFGKKATIVFFWKGDRRMAREQLADVAIDVIEPFGKKGVAVVGIAVNETAERAVEALSKAGAKFTNLLDADGKAFAKVGSERLPRTYVLDAKGNIVWFDIEYSLTTRRELHDVLRLMTE